jgi:hypothetical protein
LDFYEKLIKSIAKVLLRQWLQQEDNSKVHKLIQGGKNKTLHILKGGGTNQRPLSQAIQRSIIVHYA